MIKRSTSATLAIIALAGALLFALQARGALQGAAAANSMEVDSATLASLKGSASHYQWARLSDGQLDSHEYEAAVRATVACVEQAGPRLTVPLEPTNRGRYELSFQYSVDSPAGADAIEACRTEYLSVIDLLWAQHSAPSQSELQAARRSLAACLSRSGVPGAENAGDEYYRQMRSQPTAEFVRCAEQIQKEYDLPGFAG